MLTGLEVELHHGRHRVARASLHKLTTHEHPLVLRVHGRAPKAALHRDRPAGHAHAAPTGHPDRVSSGLVGEGRCGRIEAIGRTSKIVGVPAADGANRAAPRVIARRWDQLGGRLSAIVNAAAVAELLGLEFGFVWPRGLDLAINQPQDIFERSYLEAVEIGAEWLDGRPVIPDYELLGLSESQARQRLLEDPRSIVGVDLPFDIGRAAWEDAPVARARFARCWSALGWNEDVRDLMRTCAQAAHGRPLAAVHVRAGDIVDGDWRQVIVHEKYLPTPFIEAAIEALSRDQTVLVLSDNHRYLSWLQTRFPSVVTAAELVLGYAQLSEVHRALTDILLLTHCRTIVGPPSSAFSRLGANLGPGAIVRADELAPAGQERHLLLAGIAEHSSEIEAPYRRRLLARDICWCLDVFGDELSEADKLRLARDAVQQDGDFSGAAARLARSAAVAGDLAAARSAAARALSLAESVERYADALFEALATDVVVSCFTLLRSTARPGARWMPRPIRSRRELAERARADQCLGQIEGSFDRLLTLEPFWCVPQRAGAHLRAMIDFVRWFVAQPAPVRGRLGVALARDTDALGTGPTRVSSLEDHRAAAIYDPLTRDLDRIASRLAAARAQL